MDNDIKIVHKQIERLVPIFEEIKKGIEKDIDNPSFGEFVVRENATEKYNIRMICELIELFKAYMDATNKIVSIQMSVKPKRNELPEDDFSEDDNIEDEESILYHSKPITKKQIKKKRKEVMEQP